VYCLCLLYFVVTCLVCSFLCLFNVCIRAADPTDTTAHLDVCSSSSSLPLPLSPLLFFYPFPLLSLSSSPFFFSLSLSFLYPSLFPSLLPSYAPLPRCHLLVFSSFSYLSLSLFQVVKDDKKVESIDLGQKSHYVFGRNQDMAGIL
jgi:hypothetical protein